MYCKNCGASLPQEANVCPQCGTKVWDGPPSLPKYKGRKIVSIIVIIALLCVVIAGGIFVLQLIADTNNTSGNGNIGNGGLACKIGEQYYISELNSDRFQSGIYRASIQDGQIALDRVCMGWCSDLYVFQDKLYYVKKADNYYDEENQSFDYGLHCYDPVSSSDSALYYSPLSSGSISILGEYQGSLYFAATYYYEEVELYHVNSQGMVSKDGIGNPLCVIDTGILTANYESGSYQLRAPDGGTLKEFSGLGNIEIEKMLFRAGDYLFFLTTADKFENQLIRYNYEENTYIYARELMLKSEKMSGLSLQGFSYYGNKLYYLLLDSNSGVPVGRLFSSTLDGKKFKEVVSFGLDADFENCDRINFLDQQYLLVTDSSSGKWNILDLKGKTVMHGR